MTDLDGAPDEGAHPGRADGNRIMERTDTRRELLAQVIAAQEAERARVSRDLHDDVGQALTSVLLGLRLVEDSLARTDFDPNATLEMVGELRELVADGLRRARQLAFDLRPTVLDDIGLHAALDRLVTTMAERSGLRIDLDAAPAAVDDNEDGRLPAAVETAVYRVVQEALTNVVHHAQATAAQVTVRSGGGRLHVEVADDGRGFERTSDEDRPHLGITGMQERAELIGGTLRVESGAKRGTVVHLDVDLTDSGRG